MVVWREVPGRKERESSPGATERVLVRNGRRFLATRIAHALALVTLIAAGPASATTTPIFDFQTASATRTSLGTTATVPTTASFLSVAGFEDPVFTVGNLLNGCGLVDWGNNFSVTKTGTACKNSPATSATGHNTTDPWNYLSRQIVYTDTFTFASARQASLQVIAKLGHPEGVWMNQNQLEQFDVFLQKAGSPTVRILLAKFLDDVDSSKGQEDDAYYRYVYRAASVPAGQWQPVFVNRSGSVEFLAQMSVAPIPEPATLTIMATGLAFLGASVRWRRRRPAAPAGTG